MNYYAVTIPKVQEDIAAHRKRAKYPELVNANSQEAVILLDKFQKQQDFKKSHPNHQWKDPKENRKQERVLYDEEMWSRLKWQDKSSQSYASLQ